MLYEMVEGALESLSNQWQTLSDTLRRFAENNLPPGIIRDQIGDLTTNPPVAGSLAFRCLTQKTDVQNEKTGVRTWTPASLLLNHFNVYFRLQEIQREGIDNLFRGLFPVPPNSVDFGVCLSLFDS